MSTYHQNTEHSYKSVRKNAFYLDWRTQPNTFKSYPHFQQRFSIQEYKELEGLEFIGKITYEKTYPEGTYYLRTNPSAGALYPCEIYLQIRGIKGLLSGIYHYEPKSSTLCLIHECENDGIEYYFQDQTQLKGFQFLISSVYFRSSWKYRDRSIRYIFLDSGHCLGSIYAAMCMMDRKSKIAFDFNKFVLNEQFGFRSDEMFTVNLNSADKSTTITQPLKTNFPYVPPTNYLETNTFIEDAYKDTAQYKSEDIETISFLNDIPKEKLKNAIENRRSIRAFCMNPISNGEFEFIVEDIFTFALFHNIKIYYTLHNVIDKTQGVYSSHNLIKEGDFSKTSRYLSLEQNLGGQSAVTFYFTSSETKAYQKVNILSGFLAHIIYLRCTMQNIGCSGIGAYYDKEVQEFLETPNNILYMLAIGR